MRPPAKPKNLRVYRKAVDRYRQGIEAYLEDTPMYDRSLCAPVPRIAPADSLHRVRLRCVRQRAAQQSALRCTDDEECNVGFEGHGHDGRVGARC